MNDKTKDFLTTAENCGDTCFAAFAIATPADSANLLFKSNREKIINMIANRPMGFRAKAIIIHRKRTMTYYCMEWSLGVSGAEKVA